MPIVLKKSSGLLIALIMGFAALIVSLLAVFFSFNADRAFSAQSQASENTIVALEDIREAMLNAETGQRGFLLTGNPLYLESLEHGLRELPASFKRLDAQLNGRQTERQTARIRKAKTLVEAKTSELQESVSLYASGQADAAIALVETNEGKSIMDALRVEISSLVAQEKILLAQSRKKAVRARTIMIFTWLGVALASLLAFGVAYVSQGRTVRLGAAEQYAAELEAANERTDLLARELNHRVKNLFAIVMSIITATARSEPDSKIAARKARERVQALSMAHSFTANLEAKQTTALAQLISSVVTPQLLEDQTLDAAGPEIDIPADFVTPFGMILHELTTNAIKYGASREAAGRVELSWGKQSVGNVAELSMKWRERTAVDQDQNPNGFGSRMIDMSVSQLNGTHVRTLHADGLEFSLTMPLTRLDG